MTAATWDIPQGWEPARALARAGGTLLLIGDTDSGKSTLAAILARDAFAAGRKVTVVDADVGQSSIGPPTCVGAGRVTRPIASLSEVPAQRIDFVGSPSPVGHLLGAATSTMVMAQWARADGAETILVDTTGLISGPVARALKGAKIRLLDPDAVVAVQSDREAEHLLTPYRTRERPRLLRLAPSPRAAARSRTQRNAHRQRQFAGYFSAGRVHVLDWKQVPVENSSWTAAEPLAGHLRAHAEELLGQEVHYAARGADGLFLLAAGPASRTGLREVEGVFGVTRAVDAAVYGNLLVGLLGAHGETLALGILEKADFSAGRWHVFTPLSSAVAVRGMRLGSIQLARDGTQLAWLEPAEVG